MRLTKALQEMFKANRRNGRDQLLSQGLIADKATQHLIQIYRRVQNEKSAMTVESV